jgi:hypothetical protein
MAVIERSRRVRPGIRRVAIVAFILLVPIAMHTAWDHYEARRLARIVADIRAKQEPVTAIQGLPARAESPDNAARYYEAAASLVDARDLYGVTGLLNRLDYLPEVDRHQLVQDIRSWLERNREAEALLARATELPFEGYPPGTHYSYRTDRLYRLARLANLRTFERLEAGDTEAAAQSIVRQLRINKAVSASGPTDLSVIGMGWAAIPALRESNRFLAADPRDASLGAVQDAIRELDNDTVLEQSMLAERALALGSYWNESGAWYARHRDMPSGPLWYVMRPLMTRRFVETIHIMTTLIERARQPWPARLHVDVPDEPPDSRGPRRFPFLPIPQAGHTLGTSYRSRAQSIATALALGRTFDAAIGVERYRRATGASPDSLAQLVPAYLPAVPIDPFSGREIRYVKTADRVIVYSVGSNEKDDGGEQVDYPVLRSGALQSRRAPPDLGVSLQVAPSAAR